MKLGEALIKEGLITAQQLELALQRQVQCGGRIGTNLIELKILGEDELTKFLGSYYNLPPISPDMIACIDKEVLNLVSREIVERYKLVPLKKEKGRPACPVGRLHAAMLNPANIKELDELRLITGFDIVPYVIPELILLYALEQYYGIKRESRFTSLSDRFSPESRLGEESLERIRAAFANVQETEEIAGILINAACKVAERVGVFIVKGEKVTGWKGTGFDVEGFAGTAEELPIFSDVLRSRSYYRGPVPNIKGNEALIRLLSGTPQDVLLMPIDIREKVVALLYVDNGNNSVLDAGVGYLSKLAFMAGLAFEIMIMKKKIMES